MYCIHCGTQNLETIRYCNQCGTNLEELRHASTRGLQAPAVQQQSLIGPRHVWLILLLSALLGIAGMGIVFGCIVALATASEVTIERSSLAPLLIFLGLGGVAGVSFIVYQLIRLITAAGPTIAVKPTDAARRELRPVPELALPEPPRVAPLASVVEHTTSRLPDYAPPQREDPHQR